MKLPIDKTTRRQIFGSWSERIKQERQKIRPLINFLEELKERWSEKNIKDYFSRLLSLINGAISSGKRQFSQVEEIVQP